MIFLGIESSCDETAMALIRGKNLLAHVVYTQDHNASGGVIPQVCAREHLHHLPIVLEKLLKKSTIVLDQIGGIAVTSGPGLAGALLVGIMFAKGLAASLSKPIWPVHHLQAHGLVIRMTRDVSFPYLLMLLSGGHCMLCVAHDVQHYKILGQTRDDAVGECLDKVARTLGGPYPGGRYIEQQAQEGDPLAISLPVPLQHDPGCDFSFSGLKTACIQWIFKRKPLSPELIKNFCASFQRVIADSLCQRLAYALSQTGLKQCVISGGVAANHYFGTRLQQTAQQYNAQLFIPPMEQCTDNGIMIAWAGHEYHQRGFMPNNTFCARPQWPLSDTAHLDT